MDFNDRLGTIHNFNKDHEKARVCFEECLRIRRQVYGEDNSIDAAELLLSMGTVSESKLEFRKARNYYEEALKVYRVNDDKDYSNLAKVLSLVAGAHVELQNDEVAIKYYEESLNLYREMAFNDEKKKETKTETETEPETEPEPETETETEPKTETELEIKYKLTAHQKGYADVLYNLGYIQFRKDNFDLALLKYKEALKVFKNLLGREDLNVAKIMYSIALVYAKQKSYDKAMVFFEEVLRIQSIFRHLTDIELDVADTYLGIALLHEKKREYLKAIVNLEECLAIRTIRLGENSYEVAQVLSNIGIIRGNLHEYQTALKNWEDALRIFKRIGVTGDDANVVSTLNNVELARKLLKS